MWRYLVQAESKPESHSNIDRTTVSEIEAAVSDSLEALYGRLSNILTSRKPELLGQPEEYHRTTIAALEIALDSLTRSLFLAITAKKFHKDEPPRVHQLPFDILIPIWWEFLPVVPLEDPWGREEARFIFRYYLVQLHLLRRVCGGWRDAIDGNPRFWTYISQDVPKSE
ncbi:hypothetical protein FS837_000092 [Tulasnella sp. UAMH 9824]|nr:hypothetical protein FS837_000092 [Tulasnella sp. UAMH 9824]